MQEIVPKRVGSLWPFVLPVIILLPFLHQLTLQAIPIGLPWWLILLVVAIPTVPGTLGAIVALLSFLQSRQNTQRIQVLATNVDNSTAESAKVKENVSELAKNIDGRMEELKTVIGEKNLAVGRAEGVEAERARSPDLVVEPQQVHSALEDPGIRKQIDNIEAAVSEKKGNGEGAT